MPHLYLEYTDNLTPLPVADLLLAINQAALDTGLFGESDIKSRAQALADYRTGIATTDRAFVHVRIALLSGRSDGERQSLAGAVLSALQDVLKHAFPGEIQFSVETTELHRASYAKAVQHA